MSSSFLELWFPQLDVAHTKQKIAHALHGADDGELFLETCWSDSLSLEEGVIKEASSQSSQGFGLRAIYGDATLYAHSADLSAEAISRAAKVIQNGAASLDGIKNLSLPPHPARPLEKPPSSASLPFSEKVSTLQEMDAFARQLDPRISQVSFHLSTRSQRVALLRPDGYRGEDARLVSVLSINLTVEQRGRRERGVVRAGGQLTIDHLLAPSFWRAHVQEALRRALLSLEAISAPAGEMPVILGSGTPGILLHEAVGHGFEGDFNRKGHSVFSTLMGQQVAAKGVTVIDDGSLIHPHAHGTLSLDDEGTSTQPTTLIEDGIMVGHLCDRLNGHLMGKTSTGNGRRQSYAHAPMPRMTNTYMKAGSSSLEEMLSTVKRGLFAANFQSGQVDIVSGNFVFSACEAYLVENGKIVAPVKGATLTGNGPDTMKKIALIGGDLALDTGLGYCGKRGQSVVVGLGQPSLLISSMIVGGSS